MQALVGVFSSGHRDAAAVMARIKAIAGYTPLFQQAFPGEAEPITEENIGKAIGAYERTLTTPGPFDAFLHGDATALPPMARAGLQRFMSRGRAACHAGPPAWSCEERRDLELNTQRHCRPVPCP
jgi:cytochrome c peroxidase